ncbi:MAG: MEDS domain-containing protein, partial [Thermodesulfobacteriota bacterium]
MAAELRKSGIGVVGDLPWGSHFCHFYATREDLLDILIPWFRAGLEANEYCIWVVFDPLNADEAKEALMAGVPGADRHLADGNIEILPHAQWYLRDGAFDLRRVIDGWMDRLERARAKGYDGLRVNGNEAWLTERDWKDFAGYEDALNRMLDGRNILVMCSYLLDVTMAAGLFDVARSHRFAVARRRGAWEVVEPLKLAAVDDALKKSEGRLRTILSAMTDVILVLDAEGRYVEIAPTDPLNLYRPSEQLIGKRIHDVLPGKDADAIFRRIGLALETRRTHHFEYKMDIGSREVWFEGRISPLTENTVFWIAHDITEHKRAEEDLRKQKEILQNIFDHLPVMINFIGGDGRIRLVNREWERTLGWSIEEVRENGIDILAECYPDPQAYREVMDFIGTSNARWAPFRMRVRDGRVLDTMWAAVRLSDGTAIGIGQDVTGRKMLEEQFRQSQKMEAVGQLAGGIAHDLNNLLTAIEGYGELAISQLQAGDPLMDDIEQIMKAGDRAADLTRQLLAFSRKQILQPRVLDLNSVVREMESMLRRVIGENIELRVLPDPGLGNVMADPGQIGQVLMNLAVNARDAMPGGGTLVIETRNVLLDEEYAGRHVAISPGSYVMVAVTDTGVGMDERTQARIFEPFFTTKEAGKGTGLGLSTVYGIVKQSGGSIWVYSEVSKGTAF